MALVQIRQVEGSIQRVREGRVPIVEIALEPEERVISIELREKSWRDDNRKTRDWSWTAYVETRL